MPAGQAADFLLWGDSHAGAVLPGVEAAAVRAGKTGFVAGQTACAPLLGVDRIDLGTDHRCSDFAAAVLAFLEGRDDMPVVILAGRWALAAEGSRSDEPERSALLAPRAGGLPSGTVADNLAVFRSGLANTVAAIRATGRRVVILGGVPEIGWSVPDALGARLMHGTPLPSAPTAADVAARNARVDAVLADLGREPGVTRRPARLAVLHPRLRRRRPRRPAALRRRRSPEPHRRRRDARRADPRGGLGGGRDGRPLTAYPA